MGFKRPFESEELQELRLKQARQVDCKNKLTHFADGSPCNDDFKKAGDHFYGFERSHLPDPFESDNYVEVSNMVKGIETSVPSSLVTSNTSSGEDMGSRIVPYTSYSPNYFEFDVSRRTFVPFEGIRPSYSDLSPRREVPLGPNHQASIPLWGRQIKKSKLKPVDSFKSKFSSLPSGSDHNICDYDDGDEEKLLGTCIIPMSNEESSEVGRGRTDCNCLDEGSIRCVRQHIMEAREQLRKSFGHEYFEQLGFCDMGEELASKWSEEEERAFHAVVYSNSASLGQNFWKHLSQVFPTRPTKEFVSYYFNVFMLQRRAAQNRSNSLDIDSDDDEFHEINRASNEFRFSENDSAMDLLVYRYEHVDKEEFTLDEDEDDIVGDSDDDDDSDEDGDTRVDSGDSTGEDSGVDHVSEALDAESLDVSRSDNVFKHASAINTGSVQEYFSVQDDSCLSFELQADKVENCGLFDTSSGVGIGQSKSLPDSKDDGFSDRIGQAYLMDPCAAKVWDSCFASPTKGVDLLPTCNIIEEIFGQGTNDEQTRNDHSIN